MEDADAEELAQSIQEDPGFFENRPCLVNRVDGKNLVYAGLQRANVAHFRLGWEQIPCLVEENVPDDVMRARAIKDNTHKGRWNLEILNTWNFTVPQLKFMGVPEFVFNLGGNDPEEKEQANKPAPAMAKHWVPDCIFPSNNLYEIPTLDIDFQADTITNPVIVWGVEKRTRKIDGGTVLFYVDDYRFDAVWDKPEQILDTGCSVIAEPNISIYDTMPVSYALHLVYKKRWIARYLQTVGIKVLVDLNVSVKFQEYNLLGVPEGWNAFATRGYTERAAYLKNEIEIAKRISGKENPFMVVYGGGQQIRKIVAENNLIYIEQARGFDAKKGAA